MRGWRTAADDNNAKVGEVLAETAETKASAEDDAKVWARLGPYMDGAMMLMTMMPKSGTLLLELLRPRKLRMVIPVLGRLLRTLPRLRQLMRMILFVARLDIALVFFSYLHGLFSSLARDIFWGLS